MSTLENLVQFGKNLFTRHFQGLLIILLSTSSFLIGSQLILPAFDGINESIEEPAFFLEIFGTSVEIVDTGVVFRWNTTLHANSTVRFGLETNSLQWSVFDSNFVTQHEILVDDTVVDFDCIYYARIESWNPVVGHAIDDNNGSYYSFQLPDPDRSVPLTITDVTALPDTDGATVMWHTSKQATSKVRFGTSSTYGFTASSGVFTTNHSLWLPPLGKMTSGTTYFFMVESTDRYGNHLIDDNGGTGYQFTTLEESQTADIEPPVITDVETSVDNRSATITWMTDEPATSQVNYGVDPASLLTLSNPGLVLFHEMVLENLDPGVTYFYTVSSADAAGNTGTRGDSDHYNFTVPELTELDNTPPLFYNVEAIYNGQNNFTITWLTDENATSLLEYWSSSEQPTQLADDNLKMVHSFFIQSLEESTRYYFKIGGADATGNFAWDDNSGNNYTFDTRDLTAPELVLLEYEAASDQLDIHLVFSEPVNLIVTWGKPGTDYLDLPFIDTKNEFWLSFYPLEEKTIYEYAFNFTDAEGHSVVKNDYFFTTLDVTDPSLTSTNLIPSTTSVSVNITLDELVILNFTVSRVVGGDEFYYYSPHYASSFNFTINGLQDSTLYYLTFWIEDTSGNRAYYYGTEDYNFTTADSTPPEIFNFQHVLVNDTITFNWQTSEPTSVKIFQSTVDVPTELVYSNDSLETFHSVIITGLEEKLTYYYRIETVDDSSNSAYYPSGGDSFIITTGDWTKPAIVSISFFEGFTCINISLQLTESATVTVHYGTEPGGGLVFLGGQGESLDISISGLSESTEYYLYFEMVDFGGNIAIDTNGTDYYRVKTLTRTQTAVHAFTDTGFPVTAANFNFLIDVRELNDPSIPVTVGTLTIICQNRSWSASTQVDVTGKASIFFDVLDSDSGLYEFTISYSGVDESPYYSASAVSLGVQLNYDIFPGSDLIGISATSSAPWILPGETLEVNVTLSSNSGSTYLMGTIGSLVIRDKGSNRVLATRILEVPAPVTAHIEVFTLENLNLLYLGLNNLTIEYSGGQYKFKPGLTWLTFEILENSSDFIPVDAITGLKSTSLVGGFTVSFQTVKPVQSLVHYQTVEPLDIFSPIKGFTNIHTFKITDLLEGITYLFEIELLSGGFSTVIRNGSEPYSVVTDDNTAPEIININFVQVDDFIVITWETDESATSRVDYGTDQTLGLFLENISKTSYHEMVIIGVITATYYFKITSIDQSGNEAVDDNQGLLYQLEVDVDAPVFIFGPNHGSSNNHSIWINWITDESASYRVFLGTSPANLAITDENSSLDDGSGWNIVIDNLQEFTAYYFSIETTDSHGNRVNSSLFSEQTKDETPPVPVNIIAVADETSFLISFSTNEPARSLIRYSDSIESVPSGIETDLSSLQASHNIGVSGLVVDTVYYYEIYVKDQSGNWRWYNNNSYYYSFKTLPDQTSPVISNIMVFTTPTTVTITWSTDERADSFVNHGTDQSLGFTTSNSSYIMDHSIRLEGLQPDTHYYFEILSTDFAGNTARDDNNSQYYLFKTKEPVAVTLDGKVSGPRVEQGENLYFTVVVNASTVTVTSGLIIVTNLNTGQDQFYFLQQEINQFNWIVSDSSSGPVTYSVTYDGRTSTEEGYGLATVELAVILNDPVQAGNDPSYLDITSDKTQLLAGEDVTFTITLTSTWYFILDSPAYFALLSANYSFCFAVHEPANNVYLEYTFGITVTVPWWFEKGQQQFEIVFSGHDGADLRAASELVALEII
ncbi:MAG: fibronectin type III domain-containing protein [Candidatus Odinarchaeota archaeon]